VQSYRIALRKLDYWEILAAPSRGTIRRCRMGAIRQDCVQFALANCNAALFKSFCLQHGVSLSLPDNNVKSFCKKNIKSRKKTSKTPEKQGNSPSAVPARPFDPVSSCSLHRKLHRGLAKNGKLLIII
jgi:hypothetical protein